MRLPRIVSLVPVLAVLFSGCGGPKNAPVSGQVLYNGKPLPGGVVMFTRADGSGAPGTCELDEQGQYELEAPVGPVRISVDNRALRPQAKRPKGPPAPPMYYDKIKGSFRPQEEAPLENTRYVEIPEKYYSNQTSELEYTVTGGPQTHNIELK